MAKTYVHWNLNRDCWSVLRRGKLQEYRYRLSLRDVEFRVRPGGHRRALREGKRNVHAFAVGELGRSALPKGKTVAIRYDRDKGQFVDNQGRHVTGASIALLFPEGSVRAFQPKYAPVI
jgi:hypothetical protein